MSSSTTPSSESTPRPAASRPVSTRRVSRAAAGAEGADVLNGIAYAPELDRFFVTGKLWPAMFEVTFVAESGSDAPNGSN